MGTHVLQQLHAQMREQQATYILYWPGDEFAEVGGSPPRFSGHEFILVPDGPGLHPRTGEVGEWDGLTTISDVWGLSLEQLKASRNLYPNDTRGQMAAQAAMVADEIKLHAHEIIGHLIRKLGDRGLVLLSGIPAKDAKTREDAKARFMRWKLRVVDDALAQHRTKMAVWAKNNPGLQPPPMSDKLLSFQRFKDRHAAGLIGHKRYVCKYHDGFETDDAEDLRIHYAGSHTSRGVTDPDEAAEPDASEKIEKKRRSRKE